MSVEAPVTLERPEGRGAVTRSRILNAATALFYANGIRGVSADRIIEEVGVTKVTFYRHFRTKADLVVAYLQRQSAGEQGAFGPAREAGDPVEALRAIALGIGDWTCRPGFRGCPFINASAEFPDAAHPVRAVIDAHRGWLLGLLTAIAGNAGVADAEAAGRQLMMLRDGAMVTGYLGDPETVGEALLRGFMVVVGR